MNLRTPRRRISPRTKRRYQAIKYFLQKLLGFSSQPNINKKSSFVSISELKEKIDGIEHQLNTVSKHCQDLVSLEYNNLKANTISTVTTKVQNNVDSDTGTYTINLKEPETNVLYASLQNKHHNPRSISKATIHNDKERTKSEMINDNNALYKKNRRYKHSGLEPIQEGVQTLRKHKHHSSMENNLNYNNAGLTSSCLSFHDEKISPQNTMKSRYLDHSEIHYPKKRKKKTYEMNYCFPKDNLRFIEEKWRSKKSKKYMRPELDQDFIADIIRRQYRPVKLFCRKPSDLSQFSAPVCRDQECCTPGTVQKDSKLCSCCHGKYRHQTTSRFMHCNDLSEMQSMCDTQLYSSKRNKHRIHRREQIENYNDSTMYDIIPVKEKSSPKSKRKFVEDNVLNPTKCREVPPSPRTHRPRLNLQAQLYMEEDDDLHTEKKSRCSKEPISPKNYSNVSNISSEIIVQDRNGKRTRKLHDVNITKLYFQDDLATITSSQNPIVANEIANIDTTLNTQITGTSDDKTDKTLNEIKDILQSFLLEIKKESSHHEKQNTAPIDEQNNLDTDQLNNRNKATNSTYNNNTFGQCISPFMQSFTNPYCYPIIPMCPMNYAQNGFVVPKPSCSCAACANHSKDRTCSNNDYKNQNKVSETPSTEAQKLIKELHKLIIQNPNTIQKEDLRNYTGLTSRSVGGSSKASKHDAKVGTMMKCYSKSCEAIGSRLHTNKDCAANISYSDTLLEKGSSEASNTQSSFESEYSSESAVSVKKKENKITKILKFIGLLKKKKRIVEKQSENFDFGNSERIPARPPFEQHILNYNMHGQEYYEPLSMPIHRTRTRHHEYCNHFRSPTTCPRKHNNAKNWHGKPRPGIRPQCMSPQHSALAHYPNCCGPCSNLPLQIPLCLKEVEVKSVGTQSVRKMSLLQKLTNKVQGPAPNMKRSAQTKNSAVITRDEFEKTIGDLKKWQARAGNKTGTDPFKFSYKTRKELSENDTKMRNEMLKKLFFKRNPFSPKNLLVRTLLGKKRSSFGEAPKMYKPKMFL